MVHIFNGQNLKYELLEHQTIQAQRCPLMLEDLRNNYACKEYNLQVSARI